MASVEQLKAPRTAVHDGRPGARSTVVYDAPRAGSTTGAGMIVRWNMMAAVAICAVGACSGSSDEAAPNRTTARTEPTTEELPTTEAPTTTKATTTTSEAATTTRPTTATTSLDLLTHAVTEAGFEAPTAATRANFAELCAGFTERDAEIINSIVNGEQTLMDIVRAAFGVLCPGNIPLIGVAVMPSGDPTFPFFPRIVNVGMIDTRVASSYEGKLIDGQVVALAPGVYTPYNPNVPDLILYLTLPNDGDCIMRERYFPNAGGSCWEGVQPGSGEK